MSKQCDKPDSTHYHACDCREAKFKRLLEAAKRAKRFLPITYPNEQDARLELIRSIKECEK